MTDEELRAENLDIVRQYIDAINVWDFDAKRRRLADDAVFEMPYAPEGFERKIVGSYAIIAFVETVPSIIDAENLHDVRLETYYSDPGEIVAEYKSEMVDQTDQRRLSQRVRLAVHGSRRQDHALRRALRPDSDSSWLSAARCRVPVSRARLRSGEALAVRRPEGDRRRARPCTCACGRTLLGWPIGARREINRATTSGSGLPRQQAVHDMRDQEFSHLFRLELAIGPVPAVDPVKRAEHGQACPWAPAPMSRASGHVPRRPASRRSSRARVRCGSTAPSARWPAVTSSRSPAWTEFSLQASSPLEPVHLLRRPRVREAEPAPHRGHGLGGRPPRRAAAGDWPGSRRTVGQAPGG